MAVQHDLPVELIDYILESETPTVAWTVGDSGTDAGAPSARSQIPTPHLENGALQAYFGSSTPHSSFLDAIEDASPLQALLEACRASAQRRDRSESG
ncbi:BQ2448_3334 [Microbotryum intermedium]|uniref:BQ2448_3334 protein n=1 Tax=Microbotryum intermedium TaxID=269621 RepID=A0A238F9M8_9BASI|nr:BQ2448_3334 [Microbotryum intermedium]